MKKARIVIGANYGDEGKGTVVAAYTSRSNNVLNVLTNGGSQRGHSILTKDGSMTFQHFGAGTFHGADNYYSRYFILNPMQFVKEYDSLIVKPKNVYRDRSCRWSTPYDVMANQITEQFQRRRASCGMGIWNTIKRCNNTPVMLFDDFMALEEPVVYLESVKQYYERQLTIPDNWKDVWDAPFMKQHFLMDCKFMYEHTKVVSLSALDYENLIFENGQGLLLCDTGKDAFDKTPSNTGILYSLELLKDIQDVDITAHYVTRPYLTRHGDGDMEDQGIRQRLSSSISEDRTNHFNELQGEFRYGKLDILALQKRILSDVGSVKFELEVTHCDEMDLIGEFRKHFNIVNPHDTPLV